MKVKCEITGDLIGIDDATRFEEDKTHGRVRPYISTSIYRGHCRRRRASSLGYSEIRESIREEKEFFSLVNELLLKTRKLAVKNGVSSKQQFKLLLDTESSYCLKNYKKVSDVITCKEHISVMKWLLSNTELKLITIEDKAKEFHTPEVMINDYLKDRYHLEVI